MQKHSILDAWMGSEYACVQNASNNVLCHHNKRLMGYFEFLCGAGIICFPLNIPEKLHWRHLSEKPDEAESHLLYLINTMIQYNTNALCRTASTIQSNAYHHHFFIQKPILCLATFWSILLNVLVVTVELICFLLLNILSFNFVPTPNKVLLGWQDSEEVM